MIGIENKILRFLKEGVRKITKPAEFAIGCGVELIKLDTNGNLTNQKFIGSIGQRGEVVDKNGQVGITLDGVGLYKVFYYGGGMTIMVGNVEQPYTEIYDAKTSKMGMTSTITFKDGTGVIHTFTFEDGILINHTV